MRINDRLHGEASHSRAGAVTSPTRIWSPPVRITAGSAAITTDKRRCSDLSFPPNRSILRDISGPIRQNTGVPEKECMDT